MVHVMTQNMKVETPENMVKVSSLPVAGSGVVRHQSLFPSPVTTVATVALSLAGLKLEIPILNCIE